MMEVVMRRCLKLPSYFLILAICSFGRASPCLSQDPPPITNLGLAGEVVGGCGKWVILNSEEQLIVYDAENGTTTNTGLAAITGVDTSYLACGDKWLAFRLSEQGNSVLHVLNLETNVLTNLKLAVWSLVMTGKWLACNVSEHGQGNWDLNGDGDTDDFVLHVIDLETNVTTNLGLAAAWWPAMAGNWLALTVSECGQGNHDLNGDGDADDDVLHLHALEAGVTTNLGISTLDYLEIWEEGVAFLVDAVFHVLLFRDMMPVNLRLVAQAHACFGPPGCFTMNLSGRALCLLAEDRTLHVYDIGTGTISYVASGCSEVMDGNIATSGKWLAFKVDEDLQDKDLNGDGDRDDYVLHIHDLVAQETINLGVALWLTPLGSISASGRWLAFAFSEAAQGQQDLNGDGDYWDFIVHLLDLETRTTINLNLSRGDSLTFAGSALVLSVDEEAQRQDLNGDGDLEDKVIHVVHLEGFGPPLPFHRGDPNSSGATDLSDAITVFGHLFLGDPATLSCLESADGNNDGMIDISDGIYLLNWLFVGGPEPAAPGPTGAPCGVDPDTAGAASDLGCAEYPPCP
jgi:hypothetical protein